MTTFAERRKKMTDELYEQVKVQHRGLFDECCALGVVIHDLADRGRDPLTLAAEAERRAVLLVASALGLRPQHSSKESK